MKTRHEERIVLRVPPLIPEAKIILEVHGCVTNEGQAKVIFPAGSTRVFALTAARAMTERFKITLPDGYTLNETFDTLREESILLLHSDDMKWVHQVEALAQKVYETPNQGIYSYFQSGRKCVLKHQGSQWACQIYVEEHIPAHPFKGATLSEVIGTGINLYRLSILDIPLQEWQA